jgi:glycosyltransferase involved in cell wall biosynthesis
LVSLTFIQREIAALRTLGLNVITCSMRRTPASQHPGPAEKEAAASTFHVLEAVRSPKEFFAAQARAFKSPGRYLRAMWLAWKIRSPGLKSAAYQLIYFLEATILARHLEREGVTHMHSHFTTGSTTVAMLTSVLTDIPYSYTLHGPADFLEPYRWRLDEKTARARFVATISHYARSQLMFFSDPKHWDRIHIIHCGVSPERYDSAPKERDDGKCRMVFVGRIAPVKGLRVLLEALARLKDELPELELVLVGDGPERRDIEAVARPLANRVRFTGYLSQDEVAEELKEADIGILPSFAEGVPVFLMETLASGKPVIATQVAGVGELVKNGETGLLVSPGDVDGLVDAIRALARDPERRAAMGQGGRAKVIADFDIDQEAARLARLFAGQADGVRPSPMLP